MMNFIGFRFYFVLALTLCVLGCDPAAAQKFDAKQYAVEDGLLSNDITAMIQSTDGYLWFGTARNGLFRFDGFQSSSFSSDRGLTGDSVNVIFEDSREQLWVATSTGGVGKVRKDSLIYPFLYQNINYQTITAIAEQRSGGLWFGTAAAGVYVWENEQMYRLTVDDGLPSDTIRDFWIRGNEVWIATDRGIARYNNGKVTVQPIDGRLVETAKLFSDCSDTLWIGTSEGLYIHKESNGKSVIESVQTEKDVLWSVSDIVRSKSGDLLVATKKQGLYSIKDNRASRIYIADQVETEAAKGFYTDTQDNVWVFIQGKGVFRIRNEAFITYGKQSPLAAGDVFAVQSSGPGKNTWIATEAGLRVWNSESSEIENISSDSAPSHSIRRMTRYPNGDLLLFTAGQNLYRFDGTEYRWLEESSIIKQRAGRVFDILIDSSNRINVGTDQGLIQFGDGGPAVFSEENGLPSFFVWHLMEDRQGRLWISTSEGIRILDNGQFSRVEPLRSLGFGKYYRYSAQDHKGNYWFGTDEGIIWYRPNAEGVDAGVRLFNNHHGLQSIDTQFLGVDSTRHLWHGTAAGLHRIDLSHFYREEEIVPVHYSLSNRGPGIHFYHNSISADGESRLWFGSKKGVVTYDLSRAATSNSRPEVRISNIELSFREAGSMKRYNTSLLDGGADSGPSRLNLASHQNNLTFDFLAIDYEAPEKVLYRYRLKGRDDQWSVLDDIREVSYSELPAGSYSFEVEAKDGNGIWSQEAATFNFHISEPFIGSQRFYGILILLGMALVYGGAKIWLNTYEKKKLKLLVDKQTKDLREGIKEKEVLLAEIHHRVKNNLAVISGLIELQQDSIADPHARHAMIDTKSRIKSIAMIHEKLYKADTFSDINFQRYIEELVEMIAYSHEPEEKEIALDIDAQNVRVTLDQSIPCGLILNELLSNAYEHAFKGRKSGHIQIMLRENKDTIFLTVKDDGIGLPPQAQRQSNESLGMTLVDILSQQLAADLQIENGVGTAFHLKFSKVSQNKGPL